MEPDPKLDALGDELESLVAGLSQSPQQFLLNPGKVTRLKAMLEEVQSIGKQELDRIVAASQASAEQAKVLMAEMQEKKIQEEAAQEGAAGSCRRRGVPTPEEGLASGYRWAPTDVLVREGVHSSRRPNPACGL